MLTIDVNKAYIVKVAIRSYPESSYEKRNKETLHVRVLYVYKIANRFIARIRCTNILDP